MRQNEKKQSLKQAAKFFLKRYGVFIIMLLLVVMRIGLGYCLGAWYGTDQFYDDLAMMRGVSPERLLAPDANSLIKDLSYSLFLGVGAITNLPYSIVLAGFWALAALAIWLAVGKVVKNKWIGLFAFVYVLFLPIGFESWGGLRVYRNSIIAPSIILMFGLTMMFIINIVREASIKKTALIGVLAGLAFAFAYFLKEDGIWLKLCMVAMVIICVIVVACKHIKKRGTVREKKMGIAWFLVCLIPFGIYCLWDHAYRGVNNAFFGVYEINTRTEGELGEFVEKVYKIDSPNRNMVIWAPYDAIEATFKASPTLASHPELLEAIKTTDWVFDGDIIANPINKDFLTWVIRIELTNTGLWTSEEEVQSMFARVNEELDSAFRLGGLKKAEGRLQILPSTGGYTMEEIFRSDIAEQIGLSIRDAIWLNDYQIGHGYSSDMHYELYENRILHMKNDINVPVGKKRELGKKVANVITWVYRVVNTLLVVMSVGFIVWQVVLLIRGGKRYAEKNLLALCCAGVSLAFFSVTLAYCFATAWFFAYPIGEMQYMREVFIFYRVGVPGLMTLVYLPCMVGMYFGLMNVRRSRNRSKKSFLDPFDEDDYQVWIKNVEKGNKSNIRDGVRIALLMDARGVKWRKLKSSVRSVLLQNYESFKLYIVVCASKKKKIERLIKKYNCEEKVELVIRDKKEGTARVFNEKVKNIKEGFLGFVGGGDLMVESALSEMVQALDNGKKVDLIYSDEDKIKGRGERCEPHFKPDYSPDTLLGFNYIGHLTLMRMEMVHRVGNLDEKLKYAWDYDLYLRLTEKSEKIAHIPVVLYHGDLSKGASRDDAEEKDNESKKVIEAALARRGNKAKVRKVIAGYYEVIYDVTDEPLVSIIIPIKDQARTTEVCLKSIYDKTRYKNYEVIIVNNRSVEGETFRLLEKYQKAHDNFRVVDADMEFNYSVINNLAVKKAKGKYILLMNNDMEVISLDWLGKMVGYARQPHVGAVGAMLLYRDKKIQHAGVVLGLGASRVAGHAYHNLNEEEVHSYGRISVPYDYSAVTAACLCVEKKKFEEVGGMEEGLAVAFNDVDLNVKLLQRGYYNVLLPEVKLFHDESKSRGLDVLPEKRERFIREMNLMKVRWKGQLPQDRFYNENFSLDSSFMLKGKESNE